MMESNIETVWARQCYAWMGLRAVTPARRDEAYEGKEKWRDDDAKRVGKHLNEGRKWAERDES